MAGKKKMTRAEAEAMRQELEAYDQKQREEAEAQIASDMAPLDDLVSAVFTPEIKKKAQEAAALPILTPETRQLLDAIVRCLEVLPGSIEQTRTVAVNNIVNPSAEGGEETPPEAEAE